MARTWLSVTVELLGGRGVELWPWPGRVFAVGPAHTFKDLATAIDDAFARWDRSHLSLFTLDDGRVVADAALGSDLAGGIGGPISEPVDIATAKVAAFAATGSEFQYTFDLGDEWTHRCVVGDLKVDPVDVLGIKPKAPLAYFGWGDIPDQYGRRTADGDDETPPRPTVPHPMLVGQWPAQKEIRALDLGEVRGSIASSDADRFLDAVIGCDLHDALQQVGPGVPMALQKRRERAEPVAVSIVEQLNRRGEAGDAELAEELLASLRGEPAPGRPIAVDLEMLSDEMEGDPNRSTGGLIDLSTGFVYNDEMLDPGVLDEEIDVEEDPDRWLRFDCIGSRDSWRDMADFATRTTDPDLRNRLERAIEGRGAFRRFRDVVHEAGVSQQWYAFSTDRKFGRARKFLVRQGIRPV